MAFSPKRRCIPYVWLSALGDGRKKYQNWLKQRGEYIYRPFREKWQSHILGATDHWAYWKGFLVQEEEHEPDFFSIALKGLRSLTCRDFPCIFLVFEGEKYPGIIKVEKMALIAQSL